MTCTVKKVNLSKLVFDEAVYPRGDVDGTAVSRLMEARRCGVELPPVRADRKTLILRSATNRSSK
jgi:hypothetical protein